MSDSDDPLLKEQKSTYDPSRVEAFLEESERVVEEVLKKLDDTKEMLRQLGITDEFMQKHKDIVASEEEKAQAVAILESWGFGDLLSQVAGPDMTLDSFLEQKENKENFPNLNETIDPKTVETKKKINQKSIKRFKMI